MRQDCFDTTNSQYWEWFVAEQMLGVVRNRIVAEQILGVIVRQNCCRANIVSS